MQSSLEDLAIKAALNGDWVEAIRRNQQVLDTKPDHIPTLNRLAKALAQTGKNDQAIELYQRVISLDKFNPIANKQCSLLTKRPCVPQQSVKISMTDFIEEPGKTKTCHLVRLGDAKLLASLQSGQPVQLVVKNHWIVVTTTDNKHIGCLVDNISLQLKQDLASGCCYQTVVQSASPSQVTIFIRANQSRK